MYEILVNLKKKTILNYERPDTQLWVTFQFYYEKKISDIITNN